jgi:hypothetical protein
MLGRCLTILEEAKGTLKHDVTSINEKDKANLLKLSVAAVNDVTKKKSKSGKTQKTIVELPETDGMKIQITATKKEGQSSRATVEDKIRSIGLLDVITDKLIEKYSIGEITQNHVRDICKINTIENVTALDSSSQESLIETIIKNRNEQNDSNSSEAAVILLTNNKISKYIVDNWYRGILRMIEKVSLYTEVSEDTICRLSYEQKHFLSEKINDLIAKLEKLLSLLKNTSTY